MFFDNECEIIFAIIWRKPYLIGFQINLFNNQRLKSTFNTLWRQFKIGEMITGLSYLNS